MPTWIIDPAGAGDYTSIQAAIDAIPPTLTESYTLRLRSTTEFVVSSNVNIAQRTMNGNWIVIEPHPGFGFADHPNAATNALRYNPSNGIAIRNTNEYQSAIFIDTDNVELRGLQLNNNVGHPVVNHLQRAGLRNLRVINCILENSSTANNARPLATSHAIVENTVLVHRSNSTGVVGHLTGPSSTFSNCVIVNTAGTTQAAFERGFGSNQYTLRNCAIFGYGSIAPGGIATGSHNATNLASVGFGTNNLTNLNAADQFENVNFNSQDWRTRSGAALLGAGSALGTTTDIIGRTRPAPPAIGVWDFPAGESGGTPRVIGCIIVS